MPQDNAGEARERTDAARNQTPPKTGPDVIASYLKHLPSSPGVYRMIDAKGEVIYVGKARNLRARVSNYTRIAASAGAVNLTINLLQRAFLLRSCSDAVFETRTRPCLLYQIKRCSAPCTGEIGLEDYNRLVDEATRFLRGESQNVRRHYQKLMEEAAEALEFERAAELRNRLWALAHVTADQAINPEGVEEADVFGVAQEGGQTCIQVFFFRTGQNWGNRAYFPKADRSLDSAEVLESFIAQFYDDKPVPPLILLSESPPGRELLAEALSTKAERRVEVRVPRRGSKVGVVEHALRNAREALARRLAESSSQRILLEGVAERFGLPQTPRRIEVFDNSHIMGTNAVGAMIVAGPDGFVKGQYRKFNIKSADLTPGDDYAMMREVLTRRFKRLTARPPLSEEPVPRQPGAWDHAPGSEAMATDAESRLMPPQPASIGERGADGIPFGVLRAETASETGFENGNGEADQGDLAPALFEEAAAGEADSEDIPDRPDLVLIDGGSGQLAVACEVLQELGISSIAVVGVAKGPDRDAGREHFYVPGRERPFMLEPRDPVLYFIQRLRDEAHRFAIGTHRAKRAKAISANPLDEIPGIGPTRKRALLQHFGSAKAVSRAGVADLKEVPGISAQMAQAIYDFFHERRH